MKRLLLGLLLSCIAADLFAGFSSGGGRSGFSGGSRSYSSSRGSVSRNYYTRSYTASRSYNYATPHTKIINHHHSSGFGFGGGFFSGLLGGYIGGSLANNHAPVVVASGAQVTPQGQGMLMEPAYAYNSPNSGYAIILILGLVAICCIIVLLIQKFLCGPSHRHW